MNIQNTLVSFPEELLNNNFMDANFFCKLDYKTYTTLSCCSKIFNKMANIYSKISWPITVTPLKELKGVQFALHHVGCGILATHHKALRANGWMFSGITYQVDLQEIYDLVNDELIVKDYQVAAGKELINAKLKREIATCSDIPYASKTFLEQNQDTPFSTDTSFELPVEEVSTNNFYFKQEYKHEQYYTVLKKNEGELLNFQSKMRSLFVSSDNNQYLIYQNLFNGITVFDLKSDKIKSIELDLDSDERLHKFIYHESTAHLVFSSSQSYFNNLLINIYDVKNDCFLKRISTDIKTLDDLDLLLYVPEEKFLVTAATENKQFVCKIYHLESEELVRTIKLYRAIPVTQLSFRNQVLYVTQHDFNSDCIISKIDFKKTMPDSPAKKKIEKESDSDCPIS